MSAAIANQVKAAELLLKSGIPMSSYFDLEINCVQVPMRAQLTAQDGPLSCGHPTTATLTYAAWPELSKKHSNFAYRLPNCY